MYTTVAISVPSVVALATVAAELVTLPDGIVAHSIPKKAKKVKVVVAVIAAILLVPLVLKGKKFSH